MKQYFIFFSHAVILYTFSENRYKKHKYKRATGYTLRKKSPKHSLVHFSYAKPLIITTKTTYVEYKAGLRYQYQYLTENFDAYVDFEFDDDADDDENDNDRKNNEDEDYNENNNDENNENNNDKDNN